MRVSFLSPRLSPAVCGLADHTRLLGKALVDQDVEVGFICLQRPQQGGNLPAGPVDQWEGAAGGLLGCVTRQAPDWLWVQLSGYGYSRWGAPYRLARELTRLRQKMPQVRLAICVHETHCQPTQLGMKGPLLAPWQRYTTGRVVRLGDVVFPTIPRWQQRVIAEYHVSPQKVMLLPIGSNVPAAMLAPDERSRLRRQMGWGDDEVIAVAFGQYVTQLRTLEQFEGLLLRGLVGKHLSRVICVGGEQPDAPQELIARSRAFPPGGCEVLGPRPAEEIGEMLECCDFALAATSGAAVKKSGAFMAFAGAGLPVLVHNTGVHGRLDDQDLPVLSAESWDWRHVRSPHVREVGRALRKRAEVEYGWDAIARAALARLRAQDVGNMKLVPNCP